MDEKLSAITRLEEVLDSKDDEIWNLKKRIEELESLEEYATWGWARHIEIQDDKLPTPRLQIEHRMIDSDGYNQEWIYSLVYKHFLGYTVKVPLGHTHVGGALRPGASIESILPFRDGVHFKHDMKNLGLPGYVIYQGEATQYFPDPPPNTKGD